MSTSSPTAVAPRTPLSIAVTVGAAVFVAMMIGVGGYQAVAAHVVGAFMLGVDPAPHHHPVIGVVPGSALSMCSQSQAEESSPFITVHSASWRESMSARSSHSPPGLVDVCN